MRKLRWKKNTREPRELMLRRARPIGEGAGGLHGSPQTCHRRRSLTEDVDLPAGHTGVRVEDRPVGKYTHVLAN